MIIALRGIIGIAPAKPTRQRDIGKSERPPLPISGGVSAVIAKMPGIARKVFLRGSASGAKMRVLYCLICHLRPFDLVYQVIPEAASFTKEVRGFGADIIA